MLRESVKVVFPIEQKPYRAECAARGEEDDVMHPLARGSVRQAHTLF